MINNILARNRKFQEEIFHIDSEATKTGVVRSYVYITVCPHVQRDNPLAKARGLSPRRDGQTVLYNYYIKYYLL